MKKKAIVAAIFLGAALLALATLVSKRQEPEVTSELSDEIRVIRTNGGLLEVNTEIVTETFSRPFDHEILWIYVGTTIGRIRVPAHYTYRIRLASKWKILRKRDEFVVIAPNVEPKLPVAVDLSKMEKESSGLWSLFTGTTALNDLERSITSKLEQNAKSPLYINRQRDAARKTVAEFVKKWLLTQAKWNKLEGMRMRVLFQDEPMESLGPIGSQLFENS